MIDEAVARDSRSYVSPGPTNGATGGSPAWGAGATVSSHRRLAGLRHTNRFELKYAMSVEAATAFKEGLLPYVRADPHAGPDGCYGLESLYFDTDDRRFYWEKIDGVKVRRKLRIRRYHTGDSLDSARPVFVEIKQRMNRVTQKRRVSLAYRDALRLCTGGAVPDPATQDAATLDEVTDLVLRYDLRPSAITAYTREALVGNDVDAGLRITFDRDLRYRVGDLALHSGVPGIPMLPPTWLVLEVKVNERIPFWLTELVGRHNCPLIRMSKYCQALEAAGTMPRSIFYLDGPTLDERISR